MRGTRTCQPNNGLVSNQDSVSRSFTAAPTTTRLGTARAPTTSLACESTVVVVSWWTVVPRTVTATGVSAARPAPSSSARVPANCSGVPRQTTVAVAGAAATTSAAVLAGPSTCTDEHVPVVKGTPA